MRSISLLSLGAWFTSVLCAHVPVFHHTYAPERPAQLVGTWKGERYPVIHHSGVSAVVDVNGKRRQTSAKAGLALRIADRYAPGFVTMQNTSAKSWDVEHYIDGAYTSTTPGWSNFEAELSADRNLEDVFITLVVFESGEERSEDPPRIAMLGVPVGDLKEGEKRRISARLPALNSRLKISFAALVFTRDGQVRSSGPERTISRFFDRQERYTLRRTINERVLAGVDAPLQVVRMLPVELEDELATRYRGQQVKVRLYVGIDGAVEGAALLDVRDRPLQQQLERQLKHWLFVPPMKGGVIVRQEVILPLQL
ncbi:MAG TPA: hypothetical protein VHF69_05405 [Candidatus Synoicihabitans sp.]|nr:hypothetical protein [Candidatus Synoicihabitans sp.]